MRSRRSVPETTPRWVITRFTTFQLSAAVVLQCLALVACSSTQEAPLAEMVEVPTVVNMTPTDAKEALEDAGFKVEFTRPTTWCIPEDPLCSGDLDAEALKKLDVGTQSGTQGMKRPEGSTITLIFGSPVEEITVE